MQSELLYDHVFDAQQHFRLILDSMARPGKINRFPDMDPVGTAGINQASLLIAFALLNSDAFFSVPDDTGNTVAQYITLHTAANAITAQQADFVFIPGTYDSEFIGGLKTGTLSYPEDGATIIACVAGIGSQLKSADTMRLILKGPGVESATTVYLNGLNHELLIAIKEQNTEFPMGIDLILTDPQNNMICVPRSNDFTFEAVAEDVI